MRKAEIITAALLLLLSLAMIFFIIPAQTEPGEEYGVPPSTLPTAAMVGVGGLSLILLISRLRQKDDPTPNPLPKASWKHIGFFAAVLFGGLAAINWLTFIPGGILIIASLMLITGQRKPLVIGLISITTPCLIYVALWEGLRIPLP